MRGFDSETVDFRSLTGSKQTINRRLTLDDSGDLMIHNTTFGDAGRFMCIVQNVRFFSGIIHNLRIECNGFISKFARLGDEWPVNVKGLVRN